MNRFSCQQLQDALDTVSKKRDLVVQKLISSRENSCVFLATTDTGSIDRVAIKCCYQPGTNLPDEETAARQYSALGVFHKSFQSAGRCFRVVEPIFFDRSLAAYGMSWVAGKSLTESVRHCYSPRRVVGYFELAGKWLGNFHALGPIRRAPPDLSAQIRHMEVMEREPLDHRCFHEGLLFLRSSSFALVSGVSSTSWLHGDCKTDNVMLSEEGMVFGIDIALAHENSVEMDLAMFLNDLDLRLQTPGFIHLAPMNADFRSAFLKGYGSLGPSIDLAFLQKRRLWSALTLWHASVVHMQPKRLKKFYLNWVFSKLVRRLVKDLSGSQAHRSPVH